MDGHEIVELDTGTAKARMLMARADAASLSRVELVAAIFNMKGRPRPIVGHFKDWHDWEQEADRELAGMHAEADRLRSLQRALTAGDSDDEPDHYSRRLERLEAAIATYEAERIIDRQPRGRIALVGCERKRGAPDVIQLRFTAPQHEFVTHIALGARQPDGTFRVLGGAALTMPIAVLADAMIRIGVRITAAGLLPAPGERLALPSAFRASIEDADRTGPIMPVLE